MARRSFLLLLVPLALLPTGNASAEIVWPSAMAFTIDTGVETPLVLFGFNPQPEPPPQALVGQVFDPDAAIQEVSGVQPTPFQLYLASEDGTFTVPPEPIEDFDSLSIPFTTTSGVDLTFVVTLTPDGDGDASTGISDPLFFNPQPEPPPPLEDGIAFVFAFEGLRSGDSVQATLQIFDEGGQAIPISAAPQVPLAGGRGAALLAGALVAGGGLAARMRA